MISSTQLKGLLEQEDARGLQWLSDKMKQSGLTIDDVGEEGQAVSFVFEHLHVDVKPVVEQDKAVFDVVVHGNATLRSFAENISLDEKITVDRKTYKEVIP